MRILPRPSAEGPTPSGLQAETLVHLCYHQRKTGSRWRGWRGWLALRAWTVCRHRWSLNLGPFQALTCHRLKYYLTHVLPWGDWRPSLGTSPPMCLWWACRTQEPPSAALAPPPAHSERSPRAYSGWSHRGLPSSPCTPKQQSPFTRWPFMQRCSKEKTSLMLPTWLFGSVERHLLM